MNIPEGHGFIGGRTADVAKRALDAADKAGLGPEVVLTVSGGFIVPEAVLDVFENADKPKKAPAKKTPAKATAKADTKEE